MASLKCRVALIVMLVSLIASPALRADWIEDGVPVCPSLGDQWYAYIASDGAGGAFITWDEYPVGSTYMDIFCQRIDRDGNLLWSSNGVPICTAPGRQMDPQIVADGEGGAIISWRDERSGTFHIYAQRVNAAGEVQWTPDGVPVVTERYGQYMPVTVPDGHGNFIIAWRDDRSGVGQIYCQKLDGDGKALWAVNGIPVCPTVWWQNKPRATTDGAGGVIIAWEDNRYSLVYSFVYAQRIDGSGNKLWATDGVRVSGTSVTKWEVVCIEDNCGGAFIAWNSGNDGYRNIFAQRIDSTGAILSRGDVPICIAALDQTDIGMILDGAGGAFIAWCDQRDSCSDIYAQRMSGTGDLLWVANGVPIHLNPPIGFASYTHPELVQDGAGGAIICWCWGWGTPTYYDIFAQRVDPDGILLWTETAVVVCDAPDGQYYPQMTSNGEGGAILTWRDLRQDTIGAVYAMRVTANGETVATLLQSFCARAESSRIVVEWRLSEIDDDAAFIVLRAPEGGGYEELPAAGLQRDGLSFAFFDETCLRGVAYRYRVDVERAGERSVLFESEPVSLPPLALSLAQNYPNPFNPGTTIRFELPERSRVRLAVYDCAGREIACLLDGIEEEGVHAVPWDGRDARGEPAAAGIYFYRLTAGKRSLTKKLVLLR